MANPYQIGIELAMSSNHAQVLGALSRHLLGVYSHVGQLTTQFSRLGVAISGALGIAAGSELLKGLTHLVTKTKDLSHEIVQLQKMGLTNAEIDRLHKEAIRITRTVPGTTELEALRIPGQTYSMLGLENSLKIAEDLAKFHNATRKTTPAARSWPNFAKRIWLWDRR
jgi:hypothetical protein